MGLKTGVEVAVTRDLDALIRDYQSQLDAAGESARQGGAAWVEITMLQGDPRVEIVRFASEHDAGPIVMGTRGRCGIQHMLLGSVAERVMRTAPCPVLVVRAPVTPSSCAARSTLP